MAVRPKKPVKKSAAKVAKKAVGRKSSAKVASAKRGASANTVGSRRAARPTRGKARVAPPKRSIPLRPKKKQRGARRPAPRRLPAPAPEALALARRVAALALEKKAFDVLILDVTSHGPSVGYDYIVLGSGESEPQLRAILETVTGALKSEGRPARSTETSPDWVLLDLGDVVAHFFTPDRRGVYDFEELWQDAPRVAVAE